MNQENKMASESVAVVTVTYGDRKLLLQQVLDALHDAHNVDRVFVVDNGAKWDVKGDLMAIYQGWVEVVEMGENTGSAKGFSTGIERAILSGAKYIWLLDDDNQPVYSCLDELLKVYNQQCLKFSEDSLAVLAYRAEHQSDIALDVDIQRISPRINSFRGFHVLDIPYKIWRRTPFGKPRQRDVLPATVAINMAPYGGLLFRRELIQSIGLPDTEFVLYGDDHEWTHRVVRKGGKLVLVTAANIIDLDVSWDKKNGYGNEFMRKLNGEGDLRAYYSFRNRAYLDCLHLKRNNIFFYFNYYFYIFILFVFSVFLKKRSRYRLIKAAIKSGLSGRLGINDRFLL